MSSPLQRASSAAHRLFSRMTGGQVSKESLTEVADLAKRVTLAELKVDLDVLADHQNADSAPVTYVRICEAKLMTIGMFIVRRGKQLPLHDHPGMFGILKVVHGSLKINTYTLLDPSEYGLPGSVLEKYPQAGHLLTPAKFEGARTVSSEDDCCILTPVGQNIHEVITESGTAAFVDILAPPYNSLTRPCTYFRDVSVDKVDKMRYLMKIPCPHYYWCDEVPYNGPVLNFS